jgi:hypothetical protein
MPSRHGCNVQCCHRQRRLRVFRADRVACADLIGLQLSMVRIEQHDIWAFVELTVCHELIDIPLANALFRIINLRRLLEQRLSMHKY